MSAAAVFTQLREQADVLVTAAALAYAAGEISASAYGIASPGANDARAACAWLMAVLIEGADLDGDELSDLINNRLITLGLAPAAEEMT